MELVDTELVISNESQNTKIKGMGAEEFPLIPSINRDLFIKIEAGAFKKVLAQIVFSISADEARAELSGALFSLKGNTLVLAGTDSYRLAENKLEVESNFNEERQLIIPARALQEVLRIISNEGDAEEELKDVFLYASENQCLFVIGSVELVSRLIDGHYPDYQQIIPAKHLCRATIDRSELTRAVKAAAIFSRAGVNDVIFSFSAKDGFEISSASGSVGEHKSKLSGSIVGEDASITLNYRFVLEGLNALSGATVLFDVVDDQTPCLMRDEADKNYVYVIMPIKK
jgi:DNA polymerase-3 subunit beta